MRYIILLFALTLSIAKASAQDVLNEVLRTSDAIINDTAKSMDERRTALFKFDAMTYMRSKILPPYVMLDKTGLRAACSCLKPPSVASGRA